MPVPRLAEALYEAHQQRSTGSLKFLVDGRESQLLIDRGNLVGADIRSAHRSMAQSLLCAGLLDSRALDWLWAEGKGNGRRAIDLLGLPESEACEIQLLAQIERLGERATGVRFEAGTVGHQFDPIPGERAVRAADGKEATLAGDDLETVPIIEVTMDEATSPGAAASSAPGDGPTAEEPPARGEFAESDTRPADEEDVANDPADPDQAARARRQRLLRRAMENMGALAPPPTQATAVPVDASPAEPIPQPAEAQASLSADEMQLVAAVERKFHEIESGADCFAVLGLSRKATADEVKAAFLELAKVFHPDRLPTSMAHLSAKMRAVFEAVREAYETLQSDSRRASYEASLPPDIQPQKSANPADEAVEAFKRGEALLRKRDYAGAEREYHRAYLADPKATYLAAEAWAIHLDPARRDQAPRAKQMIAEAAKKDPECDRAQYQLGVIARVEGDMARAEKHFREAVRVNPRHFEAGQELRLIRMRKKKSR
jgi:tetratricopeptide (TPR) repeat protein